MGDEQATEKSSCLEEQPATGPKNEMPGFKARVTLFCLLLEHAHLCGKGDP